MVARCIGLPRFKGDPRDAANVRGWAKVSRNDSEACWLWVGTRVPTGYGVFSSARTSAHRFSYVLHKGPIPFGLEIDHLCRVRNCVNPAHLEAVTRQVNNARSFNPCALNARKTHCDSGHEFNPANTYVAPDGERCCRICRRLADQRYRDRRRAAKLPAKST